MSLEDDASRRARGLTEPPESRRLLARFSGDISTKGDATRRRMVKRLMRNLRDGLRANDLAPRLVHDRNRIFIELEPALGASTTDLDRQATRAEAVASRVFGIQSVSRVERRTYQTADDLVEAGVALFAETVRDKTFAVRARRVGDRKQIPIDSDELARTLGRRLDETAKCVDLDDPDVSVHVETMPGEAYFFLDRRVGVAGLPIGTEGRAVALVSGGFDSPVAAWQVLRRGVELDFVFCNLGGRQHQLETLRVMKVIADDWCFGTRPRFHAIDFDAVSREIQEKVTTRYWQIVLKRLMLRAAEAVAVDRDALAIVTGEAIGQVSSQTLQNLAVIAHGGTVPVLRPLVGSNKEEIIALARRIGTAELSGKVGEYCAIVPSKPATAAHLSDIEHEETRLDLSILQAAIEERAVLDLRALDIAALESPALCTETIPDDATVIDLRTKAAYQSWHYPEALHLDFTTALRAYPAFDKAQVYVLYCEYGLKSAHLAELMRREGHVASHFGGGIRQILRFAERQGIATPG